MVQVEPVDYNDSLIDHVNRAIAIVSLVHDRNPVKTSPQDKQVSHRVGNYATRYAHSGVLRGVKWRVSEPLRVHGGDEKRYEYDGCFHGDKFAEKTDAFTEILRAFYSSQFHHIFHIFNLCCDKCVVRGLYSECISN